jgi:hypothetical protein
MKKHRVVTVKVKAGKVRIDRRTVRRKGKIPLNITYVMK